MADAYDFQIESMKFRLATSDNFPYVRGTAPFRKEQFDSSPTVGDQSLTGWWVRGQLSFHRGAGLNYYEVLEDETVLNRFKTSRKVRVFELGETTLNILPDELVGTGSIPNGGISTYRGSGLAWSYGVSDGAYLSSPTGSISAIVPNDTTACERLTALGEYLYVSTFGGKIEKFYNATYNSTLYTHTQTICQLWGGKDRLWILDELGDVYAVTTSPATPPVALSAPIARLNYKSGDRASFTDNGGSVFCSTGTGTIYSFTPSLDGSLAVLSAPVIAGVLPPNEQVQCIRAHMGILLIATSHGVRFAAIDGAALTIGPLVVEWYDTGCSTIAAVGSKMIALGQEELALDTVAYEFDLSEPLDNNPLIFPYRESWRYAGGFAPANCGAIEHASQGGVCYFSDGFSDATIATDSFRTDLESTGYVTTSYHRFGTLDPKRFQKVTVRAKGAGTIQVYEVTADGTETSLGTMNAVDGSGTFDFTTTGPVERMALKFVLNRDGTDATLGPTLLGYQIKALPVPERQRILKVPLLLTDELTLRRGTRVGHKGKAYEDAKALEALESSTAIVTFTDHRTGETGSAYIDSVDFQSDKPSSENSNGFGGIAYATLRVLS